VLSRRLQDGVVFVGECFNRIFKPGELHCPNCDGALSEETAAAGEAQLVCTTRGKGCVNPIKSFESSRAMYQWRDSTWEVLARTCKEQ